MKVVIKSLMLSVVLLLSLQAFAQDPNFHIYLAFGQSNMEGMGDVSSQDRNADSRFQVLQAADCSNLSQNYGQWYTANPPIFGCWGKLGIADYFGRELLENMPSHIKVGIVPTAVGGSDIALFQKSAPVGRGKYGEGKVPDRFNGGYAWLLDLAEKAQKDGVIKGIIFHQGETNTNQTQWKNKVREVVEDLKKDLSLGDIPFLAGELLYVNQGGCCGTHNSEVSQLPNVINNAHVISANGLDGADEAHFSPQSYREFGRRYAEKMLMLVESSSSSSSSSSSGVVDLSCGTFEGSPVCCQASSDLEGDGWGSESGIDCRVVSSSTSSGSPNGSSSGGTFGFFGLMLLMASFLGVGGLVPRKK